MTNSGVRVYLEREIGRSYPPEQLYSKYEYSGQINVKVNTELKGDKNAPANRNPYSNHRQ